MRALDLAAAVVAGVTLIALVTCGMGCAAPAKQPTSAHATLGGAPRGGNAADLTPGTYELWIDQRCRREARRWSRLPSDAYVHVAEEKRFVVFRTKERLVVRSIEGDIELEAAPHKDLPGIYDIRSASGGVLSIRDDGPRGKRAELVLFGTGSPYLTCDRGSLRAADAKVAASL